MKLQCFWPWRFQRLPAIWAIKIRPGVFLGNFNNLAGMGAVRCHVYRLISLKLSNRFNNPRSDRTAWLVGAVGIYYLDYSASTRAEVLNQQGRWDTMGNSE